MARLHLTTAFELALFALATLDLAYIFFSSLVALFCLDSIIEVPVVAKLGWAVLFLVSISVAACMVVSFLKKDCRYYWPYRAFLALRMLLCGMMGVFGLFLFVFKDSNDQMRFSKWINSAFCSDACLVCTGGQHMGRLLFWASIAMFHSFGLLVLTTYAAKDLALMKNKKIGEAEKHLHDEPTTDE